MTKRRSMKQIILDKCNDYELSLSQLLTGIRKAEYVELRHRIIFEANRAGHNHRQIADALKIGRTAVTYVLIKSKRKHAAKRKQNVS